jgi:hypothetical protein
VIQGVNCNVSGGVVTLWNLPNQPPLTLPYISVGSIVLTASSDPTVSNVFNFNGIMMQNGTLDIQAPSNSRGVKVDISGLNPDGSPLTTDVFHMQAGADAGGYSVSTAASIAKTTGICTAGACDSLGKPYTCDNCSQYDASLLQIIYGGNGTAQLQGHPSAAAVFYMPNAGVTFGGNSGLNGALIAKDLSINGGGNSININYDQSLSGKGQTASNPMLASFSWKKY